MKKVTYGINGAKLNSYLKTIRKSGEALVLRTVRNEYDEDQVWLLTPYLALRVPAGWIYKEVMQPYTLTDAPEFGGWKDIQGGSRDGESLVRAVEDIMANANRTAKNTGFTAELCGAKAGAKQVRVFALEDGTPVAVNEDMAAIFERGQFVTYRGTTCNGAVVVEGEYIKGILLPVRIGSELKERMAALCACFALPVARREEQAA